MAKETKIEGVLHGEEYAVRVFAQLFKDGIVYLNDGVNSRNFSAKRNEYSEWVTSSGRRVTFLKQSQNLR